MAEYNDLERYMIEQSLTNRFYNDDETNPFYENLAKNKSFSIKALITIFNNCNVNYKKYISYSVNLTIDDIEEHYKADNDIYKNNLINTISAFYNIFEDYRIKYVNGNFIYNTFVLKNCLIKFNKYYTYELYKIYKLDINNNDYICWNPNGDFINYDLSDISKLPHDISYFNGIYNERLEEIILQYKSILKGRIDVSMQYLSYNFIINNKDLFNNIYNSYNYLYKNKSLTMTNYLDIKDNTNMFVSYKIFAYIDITLDEIIEHKLEKTKHFKYFTYNKNCSINDIINNPELNFLRDHLTLSLNAYDYDNDKDHVFKFKFAD